MTIKKTLRTAMVTLGLFSAAIAGHAHQQPENVSKLLNSPVASQAVQAPDLASLSKSFLSNPSDKATLAQVAGQLKMAPTMMSVSMEKAVSVLKLHMDPADQVTALHAMLASSFEQKDTAQKLVKMLPAENVVSSAVAHVLTLETLLSSPANWAAFNMEMWKAPKFNVQHTLAAPGVKSLQTVLNNHCAIPETSISVVDANVACAMHSSDESKSVTAGLRQAEMMDGLIIGEFNNIPVLVMHNPSGAQGAAAVYRLKESEGQKPTPFIVVSLEMAQLFKDSPNTLAFVMAHELSHVKHGHTQDQEHTDDHHEIEADAGAVEYLAGKGMPAKDIAKAYSMFEQNLGNIFPASTLQAPAFFKMMTARHNAMEHNVQNLTASMRSEMLGSYSN